MVFAMYGHPLFGNHACCEPQPKTHEMRYRWVKGHAAMSLATMQIQGNTSNGNVRHY
jgi:hypothetical protein